MSVAAQAGVRGERLAATRVCAASATAPALPVAPDAGTGRIAVPFALSLERAFRGLSVVLYVAVSIAMGALACVLVGSAFWQLAANGFATGALLDAVGLTVVGLAVFDVAKYLVEEEVMRERELRSSAEARRTLTKFLTIVIIAASLEAIVFVFEAGKEDIARLPYPVSLLAVVAALVLVLGHYQRTSRKSESEEAEG